MASKKVKRKNKADAKAMQANAHSEKAYIGGNYFGFGAPSVDMRPDETGVAQAYTLNVAVSKAIEFWELWLDGLKWEIRSESNNAVLIDSEMRHFPSNVAGTRLAHAIDYHEQCFKHSLFKSIAFSDWLHSETYIRFVPNDFGYPQALEWLNPIATEPDIYTGYITGYRYGGANEYLNLAPKQVAYRIAKRNANNDLRGTSRVLLAIDDLNIDANEKRSLKNYFKNGMLLGGLISPTDPNASLSPVQVMKLEDDLERKHKGTANAHRFAIAPANMQIETFTPPDIEKAYSIIQPLRDTILMAMGVYPQLAGDPSNANYDNTNDMKRQWWETAGIPYAKEIEGFFNKLILPTLEPYSPCYFAFDYTPYEVEKPEVVSQDFDAGIIDMYQAAELRGYEGDTDLKGIYLINNVPMSKEIIRKLANTIPSQYALDYANAASAGQSPNVNADTATSIAKPIVPTMDNPSGDEPLVTHELDSVTGKMKAVEIQDPQEQKERDKAHSEITTHYLTNETKHNHSHDLPEIVDTPNIVALDELQAWRKFYSNGKSLKRQFEQVALRGDIGDAIQAALETHDKQTILDAFKTAHDKLSVKAIQSTRLDFENSVADIMSLALASNNYGRQQWSSAMRKIIRSAATRAYIDGLVNGGVLDGVLSEDDQDTLSSHIATQSQYVTNLGEEIFKTETGISEAVAARKPILWFNRSVMPMYDAGQLSANGNRMMEFTGHDGEENCATCKRLKGQRHRHKDWARKGLRPDAVEDSDNFDCGLWECEHHLIPVMAAARGNW